MDQANSPFEEGVRRAGGVNYIRHMNAWYEKVFEDQRLKSTHIALYVALFQCWNLHRFNNPFSIFRTEVMQLSKIGSANTYTKCIKELDAWDYIQYMPSKNPLAGSKIHMYNFDNSTDNTSDNSSVTVVRPYIKHNKQTKQLNKDHQLKKNYEEPL